MALRIKQLPAGFVSPAQPVLASKPPSGPGWVHEIKHDGYRMIVRRDGPIVRLYSRNAYDWTVRLPRRFDRLPHYAARPVLLCQLKVGRGFCRR
jgi:ATP-dependent DNA ligase